jgi:hypothetical protein
MFALLFVNRHGGATGQCHDGNHIVLRFGGSLHKTERDAPGYLFGLLHIGADHITFDHITASFSFSLQNEWEYIKIKNTHKMSMTLRLLCSQPKYI